MCTKAIVFCSGASEAGSHSLEVSGHEYENVSIVGRAVGQSLEQGRGRAGGQELEQGRGKLSAAAPRTRERRNSFRCAVDPRTGRQYEQIWFPGGEEGRAGEGEGRGAEPHYANTPLQSRPGSQDSSQALSAQPRHTGNTQPALSTSSP